MGCAIKEIVKHMADYAFAVDHVGDPAWQQPKHIWHSEGFA
jgi:hypothetical protein